MTTRIKWDRTIELLPSGHRLFGEDTGLPLSKPKRYAIADESGVYPEDTDDGILWLDKSGGATGPAGRPIKVGYNATDERWYCMVPVHKDVDDHERFVTVDPATMLRLAVKFDWLIWDEKAGERYKVSHR